eukprot:1158311-Pelagomonas_calceolata.AAC.20
MAPYPPPALNSAIRGSLRDMNDADNTIVNWKEGKGYIAVPAYVGSLLSRNSRNCNRKEHVSRPGLQHIHTYHKCLDHPTIYRIGPSSSGHEA